jgi:hypothetical protein
MPKVTIWQSVVPAFPARAGCGPAVAYSRKPAMSVARARCFSVLMAALLHAFLVRLSRRALFSAPDYTIEDQHGERAHRTPP